MTRDYKSWLGLALTLIAFTLLGFSIPQMELNIGFYGLIHSLPPTYFMGLGLLGIAFVVNLTLNPSKPLPGLQTLGLITALWLIPTAVGTHPGLSLAYRSLQDIEVIVTYGLGDIDWWYLSWPGFHTPFSIMTSWGINLESILTVYPFLIQLAYALPLYIFLRNTLGKDKTKYCWVGMWIFYLGNWTAQDYFGPQSLAFLLLLTILAVVTHRSLWEGSTRKKLTITTVLIVVFSYLVITHLLTSLAVLCLLGAYALVKKSPRLAITVVVCALLVLSWDVSFGGHFTYRLCGHAYGYRLLEQGSPLIMTKSPETPTTPVTPTDPSLDPTQDPSSIAPTKLLDKAENPGILTFDPGYIIQSNVLSSLSGSDSHIAVVRVRIAYSSVFAVIGFLGAIFILVRRRNQTNIAILTMALSLSLLLPLRYAGWELMSRLYMFELPLVAYLGVILLDLKKPTFRRKEVIIVLSLLLAISNSLFLVSHYGNQAVDYWSQNQKDGYKFTRGLISEPDYRFGKLQDIYWDNGNIGFSKSFPTKSHYLVLSQCDKDIFTFLHNNPNFVDRTWDWFRTSPNYISIYKNPEFEIFKWTFKDE